MNFNEIADAVSEKWGEYAKATAKYEMLSESKKSVIATLASKWEWSEATRERIARSSEEYKVFLVWLSQARQHQLELKYEIDSLNMKFDYFRSMNSLKKREMDLL